MANLKKQEVKMDFFNNSIDVLKTIITVLSAGLVVFSLVTTMSKKDENAENQSEIK